MKRRYISSLYIYFIIYIYIIVYIYYSIQLMWPWVRAIHPLEFQQPTSVHALKQSDCLSCSSYQLWITPQLEMGFKRPPHYMLKLWPARSVVGRYSSREFLSPMAIMSCPEDGISQPLSPASSSDIPAAITALMFLEPWMVEVYTDEPSTAEHSQLLIIDPCTRYESLNYYRPLQMKLLWPRVRTLICGYKQKCFENSLTAFSMTETDAPLGPVIFPVMGLTMFTVPDVNFLLNTQCLAYCRSELHHSL